MHTGEPPVDGEQRKDSHGERDAGVQRIAVGGGDDSMARVQLAARWSETYAPTTGDSLNGVLRRFRLAYEYLDAITHGVEPPELEEPVAPAPPPRAPQPVHAPPSPGPPPTSEVDRA